LYVTAKSWVPLAAGAVVAVTRRPRAVIRRTAAPSEARRPTPTELTLSLDGQTKAAAFVAGELPGDGATVGCVPGGTPTAVAVAVATGTGELLWPPPPPQALKAMAATHSHDSRREKRLKKSTYNSLGFLFGVTASSCEDDEANVIIDDAVTKCYGPQMRSTTAPGQLADAVTIWYNGRLTPGPTVELHALTHALHYGSSVFEGIRVYPTSRGAAIFRLRDHVARLYDGAAAYGMTMPFDAQTMFETIRSTVTASGRDAAYVRPLVFYAGDTVRLAPETICPTNVLIAVLPFAGLRPGQVRYAAGLTAVMKTPSAALPSHVKAGGHYANSIRALHDVNRRGFDEAVLLNDRGEVAEGSGENIFVVRDGGVFTNERSADILPGITRDSVITLARAAGIPVTLRPLTVDDIAHADEAFFTGTAAEVVPFSRFESRDMVEGPITERLRNAYAAIVRGETPAPADWLTFA
jgi:branched-chain amino acid aminotransferase